MSEKNKQPSIAESKIFIFSKQPPLHMIKVTRLNGTVFTLNALYIEKVESFHDTTITLTTGNKYIVKDSVEEIQDRVIQFYQSVQLLSTPYVRGEIDYEE